MSDPSLDELCRLYGIRTEFGADRPVPDSTKQAILAAIGAFANDPPEIAPTDDIHPPEGARCHLPDWLGSAPGWGLFCQLYELRSDRNWGIGDFGDLARLAGLAGAAGADFLGVNPVHALFLAAPDRRSPFTPSNRRFLNPLYIAMDNLPGPAKRPALARLRKAAAVDYAGVIAAKLPSLRGVHRKSQFGSGYDRSDFDAFAEAGGGILRGHALFEALSLHFAARGDGPGWTTWPEAYRDPERPEVAAFAAEHAAEVDFHIWLQWIASRQLSAAQAAAKDAGMRLGIYLDFAVGEAPDGSATWSAAGDLLKGLTIGAPPDVFAQAGQNWNLAAPSPTAMLASDLAGFRALLAAQLDFAGALRIDHAMALRQLFLVPDGQSARAGTHLRYPFAEMMRVLAEESRRAGAVVIGEDLGWVPPGFREAMQAAQMLSYRIFYFESEHGLFRHPSAYPRMALACISTHDLPTLAAWWRGDDIRQRAGFGLIDATSAEADLARRASERQALIGALIDAGQLGHGEASAQDPELPPRILRATCRFIAATPCLLAGIRLADLVGPVESTNVPGTIDEYPNWKLRSPVAVDDIASVPAFAEVTATMREMRPRRV